MDTIPEDAYVLLADGDMWPLQPLYFTIIDTSKAFSIMNANDYRRKDRIYWKSRRYPLTNVGALKTNWKHLVQLDKINSTQVIHGYRDFVKSNGMIVCRLMSLGLDASLTGKDINDLLPAMLWKFMRMERANELIKRKIGFEFDEFSFVWYCPTILNYPIAHMGDWRLLRNLLGLVIKPDKVGAWKFIDTYWNEFRKVETSSVYS
ncbi:MAG: hypothetical protein SGCHY_000672 [Lobulomycetales sp.]